MAAIVCTAHRSADAIAFSGLCSGLVGQHAITQLCATAHSDCDVPRQSKSMLLTWADFFDRFCNLSDVQYADHAYAATWNVMSILYTTALKVPGQLLSSELVEKAFLTKRKCENLNAHWYVAIQHLSTPADWLNTSRCKLQTCAGSRFKQCRPDLHA